MTLEQVQDMIKDQPLVIQRLILPAPPPTEQQNEPQQQLLIDDEEQLATRLKLLQLHMERELDEAPNEDTTAQHHQLSGSTESHADSIQHELFRPQQIRQQYTLAGEQTQHEVCQQKRAFELTIAMFGMPPIWPHQPWQQQQHSLPITFPLPGHKRQWQKGNTEQQHQSRADSPPTKTQRVNSNAYIYLHNHFDLFRHGINDKGSKRS
ncbi:putative uncharacterized protein DDB_G0268364 [Drosophila novamexicana]|uniref:putative uncharacterized protein DDB_G0268364 n=1 Tax=Drosophila novamexicana TaxID=47314 RepID=UPI0011E5AA8F|nr:putative uncharacterized protein DDB_G0268364 [Drosophila novamexicana]